MNACKECMMSYGKALCQLGEYCPLDKSNDQSEMCALCLRLHHVNYCHEIIGLPCHDGRLVGYLLDVIKAYDTAYCDLVTGVKELIKECDVDIKNWPGPAIVTSGARYGTT